MWVTAFCFGQVSFALGAEKIRRRDMTSLLGKAFGEVSKLPDVEQNALARWLLDEIEAERKWDKKFAESEDILAQLAQEALKENKEGKTTDLDIGKL